jgi:hypothetical protein
MARLSRAGDDGPARKFIAADNAGLSAGVATMAARDNPNVLEPNPSAAAPAAYPLTTLTYAAVAPVSLDDKARLEYAAFIDYAVGVGQVPGIEFGRLPAGYTPLPVQLRVQAIAAEILVVLLKAQPPASEPPATTTAPPTTTSTTTTTTTTVAAAVSSTDASTSPRSTPAAKPPAAPSTPASPTASPVTQTTAAAESTTTTTVAAATETTEPPGSVPPTTPNLTSGVKGVGTRYAVPVLGAMVLGSGLGVMEITKRPRRRKSPFDDPDVDDAGDD